MKKIIAVSSEGGHWKQLSLLSNFLSNYDVKYVSTNRHLTAPDGKKVTFINDANKDKKFKMFVVFIRALWITLRLKPDVIISTGAAPGFAFIFWGRLLGKKTIWIDSIANASELSLSGKLAKKHASHVISQWQDVAIKEGVIFKGTLLG